MLRINREAVTHDSLVQRQFDFAYYVPKGLDIVAQLKRAVFASAWLGQDAPSILRPERAE